MTCRHPGCSEPLTRTGKRGRPPVYCPSHRPRSRQLGRLLTLPPCCRDAVLNPGHGRKLRCPQCSQWRSFLKDNRAWFYNAARSRSNGKLPDHGKLEYNTDLDLMPLLARQRN